MKDRFVRAFITAKVLQGIAVGWFFSTYTLFLLEHGLSLFQANLLNMWFMLVGALLNPPTGYLADKIGKRRVYWLGLMFWGVGMLIYGNGRQFKTFFLAEGTGAIGSALMAESLESWLRNNVEEKIANRVVGGSRAMETVAQIPSTLLGGFLAAKYGLQWPWFCSAVSSLGALFLSWLALRSLPEGRLVNEAKIGFPRMEMVLSQTWQNPCLRFSAIVAFGANAAFQPFNMFWPPILRQATGGQTWWFGSLWVGVAALTSLGSYLAAQTPAQGKKEIGIALASIGLPMVFPALFSGSPWVILAGFLFHEAGRGALITLLANYNNRYIGNLTRATENSTLSAIAGLGRMIGLGFSGALTLVFPPLQVWGISALALILLSLFAWRKK